MRTAGVSAEEKIELQAYHEGEWVRVGDPYDVYMDASMARGRLIAAAYAEDIDLGVEVMRDTRVVRLICTLANVIEEN